jgi:plasmid stability protein
MATVTIRDLDDKVVAKLKARAKNNHRSLEAELRELLSGIVKEQERRQRFLIVFSCCAKIAGDESYRRCQRSDEVVCR